MRDFCFFCITYNKDYKAFTLMIESFKRHNIDKIPFVVAIQDESIYDEKNIIYDRNGGGRI